MNSTTKINCESLICLSVRSKTTKETDRDTVDT